jgi:tRNA(Arg) A34 adenosine deaminase TadA
MDKSKSKINRFTYLTNNSVENNMNNIHIAGIYKNSKLICIGHNHLRTCYYGNVMWSTHAEIDVLRKFINSYTKFYYNNSYNIRRKMKKYIIYVTKDDIDKNSKPCTDCMYQLNIVGICKIVYSNNSKIYTINTNNYTETRQSFSNIRNNDHIKNMSLI